MLQNLALPGSDTLNRVQEAVPKARLVTSDTCQAELERKEMEKNQQTEEKERKKKVREEKKLERLKK